MSSSTDLNRRDNSDDSSSDDDDGSWRNIFSIVRKWKLTFNGDSDESIKLFLTRVKQSQEVLSDLSESELVAALPCLLTGPALMWYRLIRKKWYSWESFCKDARHVFRNSEKYNLELLEKAHARTQSKDEPVADYIDDLHRLMDLQDPEPALDTQIKLLYSNMLPALQRLVCRAEIKYIETFYRRAMDAERMIDEQRRYKPPPAPEDSSVPELAYKPLVEGVRKMKLKPEVEAIVSEVIDEKLRKIGIVPEAGGHQSVSEDDKSDSKGARRRNIDHVQCFDCGEFGHFARDCTR